ncbi:MAG: hypothetical protein J7L38_00805 [Thermoproteales archaeon]|nr:hypothetical protein [Thermoproteales archaeon]
MPNITLSIPEEVYRKMKKYSEVKWSEVARKAIMEYLRKLEGTVSSEELLEELGEDFARELREISLEKAANYYEKAREAEWKRYSTIHAR